MTDLENASTELVGNALFSSVTRKLDSSARPANPSRASARKSSGTNERSAKYAIIAARCVPRSAKNLLKTSRIRREASLSAMTGAARRAERDLLAGRRRRSLRRRRQGHRVDAPRRAAPHGLQPAPARSSRRPAARASGDPTAARGGDGGGSLFVAREGERLIAASTSAEPTAGLVFYDLKSCLRRGGRSRSRSASPAPAKKNGLRKLLALGARRSFAAGIGL